MGLINKLKNIFYDVEEVEEVPVKREEVKVEEIPTFKKEEIKTNNVKEEPKKEQYSERELFQSKSTFNFPIFEDEEPTIKTRLKTIESKRDEIRKDNFKYKPIEPVVKKEFKPSPVISPVYGILDKNYKREEIVDKKESLSNTLEINCAYDVVRKKAYGTLEEELENTLTKMNDNIVSSVNELTNDIDELTKKSSTSDLSNLLGKIESDDENFSNKSNMTIQQAEEKYKNNNFDETISDNTLEHDLFNLIDSMYDKEE